MGNSSKHTNEFKSTLKAPSLIKENPIIKDKAQTLKQYPKVLILPTHALQNHFAL